MSHDEYLGWRARAISLASLGAAALGRVAFSPAHAEDPQPLQMQVLVALVLGDSFPADPPPRTGTHWLSEALRLDQSHVEQLVGSLERARLVRRDFDPEELHAIQHELAEDADDDLVEGELPIMVTELGFQAFERWFSRTRLHFGNWPPDRPDVDDT